MVTEFFLALPAGEPLDLHHTFRCGQIFRWTQHGDTWYGPYGGGSVAVQPAEGGLTVRALGIEVQPAGLTRFLGLDASLREVYRVLERDRWTRAAVRAVPGMRLLRQEPWECVAGYICSQNSNIPKIELSLERISRRWGVVHRWPEGVEVASFPPAAALAGLSVEELWPCALGYRCRYLIRSARQIASGEVDLEALRALPY
ncbi:MAG TPA: DNA glycosylase, partial [Armatimonadota bacterium]|nr:DNA glycosylase [Armatimonadota bacterium]